MTATATKYRYQLPPKSIKADCPDCGPKHRRTLSRYVDAKTDDPVPLPYGRCDRESNCGYHLSPYDKGNSGMSYADSIYQSSKSLMQTVPAYYPTPLVKPLPPVPVETVIYTIPDEVFNPTIGHYSNNQFAKLLQHEFGTDKAAELLQRFQIGTSAHWEGATVFWLIDELQRVRAGQVVLFGDDWHRTKYTDREGRKQACISSVSHGLLKRYRKAGQLVPAWLTDYHDNAPRWPSLFGVHQLAAADDSQPVAIVEAPKTAVLCAAYFPQFIWLAVGALSYLTLNTDDGRQRLSPLKNRAVMLLPDLSKDGKTYAKWNSRADELRAEGYRVTVVDYLERTASEIDKEQGLDLADFLLRKQSVADEDLLPITRIKYAHDKPFSPFAPTPLSWDAAYQLERIRWCVLPIDADEECLINQ